MNRRGKLDTVVVNGPEDVLEWDAVDWRVHEENVARLRRRIFKATREQDWATVRSLQKLMLGSWSNTLISVRQVTQRNTGRRTAGIDGEVALSSPERAEMAVRVHRTPLGLGPVAGSACVHPEGQRQDEAAPTRYPGDHGSVPSGTGPQRAGTGVGGPIRTQVVWVSAGPWLCRCDRLAVHHGERQEQAGVDHRCRPVGGVRCSATLLLSLIVMIKIVLPGWVGAGYAGLFGVRCARARL